MTPIRPENRGLYPPDWKEIRAAILIRAGNRCEGTPARPRCRVENGDPIYGDGDALLGLRSNVVLTIAHLDHDPRNSDPANLRALCQKCHNGYDAKRRAADLARRRASARADRDLYL